MKEARVMIVGFGVVGEGVAEVLDSKKKQLEKLGVKLSLVAVCEKDGCIVDEKGIGVSELLKLKKAGELQKHSGWKKKMRSVDAIREVDCDIVVEVTPTNVESGEPGLTHIATALDSKKHVVTSNKGPLALKFSELVEKAEKNNVELKYEATVCGGMPVFNMVENALASNEIKSIKGILNGTTNFILSRMHETGVTFEVALKEAKEMGIAEEKPDYDVKGIDAAAKITILANALMGRKLAYKDVKRVGIEEIIPEGIALAKKSGFAIKLIGEITGDKASVSPQLIPLGHPLNVGGTLNALMLETDLAKEVIVIGRGAGKIETASAIISDVLEIVKSRK
ncbi:homoserine dehydrogenase [Candidatus Micrarchaeota archaeon]|nr:homoserine dehydrogenase [Candidatus Micrarchaeota archaeon]